jgi:hypothetical protein
VKLTYHSSVEVKNAHHFPTSQKTAALKQRLDLIHWTCILHNTTLTPMAGVKSLETAFGKRNIFQVLQMSQQQRDKATANSTSLQVYYSFEGRKKLGQAITAMSRYICAQSKCLASWL